LDAKRVGGKILKIFHRLKIGKVTAEEYAVIVLNLHQFALEAGSIQVEKHLFIPIEFQIVRLGSYIEFRFVSGYLLLAGDYDEEEDE
jgi:hypothetical protein